LLRSDSGILTIANLKINCNNGIFKNLCFEMNYNEKPPDASGQRNEEVANTVDVFYPNHFTSFSTLKLFFLNTTYHASSAQQPRHLLKRKAKNDSSASGLLHFD